MLSRIFINRSGEIRSGWKILIFIQLIALYSRTFLTDIFSFLPFDIDILLVLTALSFFMIRIFDRKPLRTLGIFPEKGWSKDFFVGFAAAASVQILMFLILWQAGFLTWKINPENYLGGFMAGILLNIFVSTHQEVLFRGYIFRKFNEGTGKIAAVLITSVAFSLYHSTAGILGWINICFIGIIMAVVTLRRGTLWFAIGMHIGWNIFEGSILSMMVSGGKAGTNLLVTEMSGSELFTGGVFGPEASIIVFPIVIGMLIWCWKTRLFEERIEFTHNHGKSAGFKPAYGIAIGMLAFIGPLYYLTVHVPSMADIQPGEMANQPVILYKAPSGENSANEVRRVELSEFKAGSGNILKIVVAIDKERFDSMDFSIISRSHSIIKRQVINHKHREENLKAINTIEIPIELPRLRKNTVIEMEITANSPRNEKYFTVASNKYLLKRYVNKKTVTGNLK